MIVCRNSGCAHLRRVMGSAGARFALAGLLTALALVSWACKRREWPPPVIEELRGLGDAPVVRVQLYVGKGPLVVRSEGNWEYVIGQVLADGRPSALEEGGDESAPVEVCTPLAPYAEVSVSVSANGLTLAGQPLDGTEVIFRSTGERPLLFNGRPYRGTLHVRYFGGELVRVVNLVGAEDYVPAVVGGEVPTNWPLESLKAQAVAARTYVLYWHQVREGGEYDVLADTRDQVYIGMAGENARTLAAAAATRGLVMTYHGALFPAYYHSTCGGHTEDATAVFPRTQAHFLKGVLCGYCDTAPRFAWRVRLPLGIVRERLSSAYARLGAIVEAETEVGERRVEYVVLYTEQGKTSIPVHLFRHLVAPDKIHSLWFTARVAGDELVIEGRGHGHGVGMCQYGARGMAKAGFPWHQILAHYYPEASLARLY